ncbi:hypothetical protein [Streptomyces swartbergensis]|uniref:hypothetical protein n=1 Tax=Streptomyces swartbergensis TaxID=487165 RepID=UPI0013029676|nr:hypothetical protein [Streptomyces swartbergensis]
MHDVTVEVERQPVRTSSKSSTFTELPGFASEDTPTWTDPLVTVMPELLTFVQLPIDWLIARSISPAPKFLAKMFADFYPPPLFTQADNVYVPFGTVMFWYMLAL